jgi:hypothetical protein
MHRVIVASLISTFALAASAATPPPANSAADSAPVQVTTGVTYPRLETAAIVQIDGDATLESLPSPTAMRLHVDVDAAGNVTSVEVVHPISRNVDAQVVRAVRMFHWQPASLDNHRVADSVDLIVEVQH